MTENTGSAAALICRTSRKCPKASSAAVSRATATGKPTVERLNSTEQVGEHDTRLWRFIRHYVDEARLYEDYTGVEAIGIDETSRKGHRYITVVADLVERNVICVVPGKDSTTIKRFARDFMDHNGDPFFLL